MKSPLTVLLAAASVVLALAIPWSTALAAEPTTLALGQRPMLDAKGKPVPGQVILVARLATSDGKPTNGLAVTFAEEVDLFGPRQAALGVAQTDSTGTAVLAYQPPSANAHHVVVKFGGDENFAAAQGKLAVKLAVARPPFENQEPPLAAIRPWVPIGLGVLIASAWAVLLGTLGRAARAIRWGQSKGATVVLVEEVAIDR